MIDLYKLPVIKILFILLLPYSLCAQFKGGNSSGFTYSLGANKNLGRNIFTGGNDDGNDYALASNQPLGRNIFKGGNDDGTNYVLASNQPLGRNIFLGGIDDGNSVSLASNQLLGRNIFKGGNDDGSDYAIAGNQPLGRNIFTGGSNDGWAMAFASNVALPVTLTQFNGQWQQNDAILYWKTATEMNSSHFELERSFNGTSFTSIQRINAAGQSSVIKNYEYTDVDIKKLVPPGITTVYYRLRSVDKNGVAEYSGIVVLKVSANSDIQYSVYPNPAKDLITITASQLPVTKNSYIRIADVSGKLLLMQKLTSGNQQLSVSAFTNGTYFLQLVTEAQVLFTQKILIHK